MKKLASVFVVCAALGMAANVGSANVLATQIQSAVMEIPKEQSGRPNLWIFVLLGLVVVAALYLAFR